MAYRHVVLVTLALFVVGPAASARAQSPCTAAQGQSDIDQGRYKQALKEFTCVVDGSPTEVDGYRGRIEAQLLLGLYSDALRDYGRVTALVLPAHPDAATTILTGYDARLAAEPQSIPALTGKSFAHWWLFQYAEATHVLNDLLLVHPADVFGNLFRGSSRLLRGATNAGVADLDYAISLAPQSPDVHFVAADAYTYGLPDPERAFLEASLALNGGLDTARVHAILAASYEAFGEVLAAATHIKRHFDLVTTELASAPAILAGKSVTVALAPGRSVEIPVPVLSGETINIVTSSKDYWDTIAVVLAPDGAPVIGSDDGKSYFAAFEWTAPQTATYRLRVTFFESLNSGLILITRK
jgi:tetratricopeptide (TPR) repeat protein